MLFSIIIPVYNVEAYLRECLDSVLSQSFTDYEIICVNDGSADGSAEILQEYALSYQNIKVHTTLKNGLSEARNYGISKAKGDYLMFLDSDDLILPGSLEKLAAEVIDEDLVCFNGFRFYEKGDKDSPDDICCDNNLTGWEYYNKYALASRKFPFVCVVLRLYKRTFLLNNAIEFEKGIYHEDNLFTPIVCYYAQRVKIIPIPVYAYRIRENSISQTHSLKHKQDIISIANKLASFFISEEGIEKTVVYRSITHHYQKVFLNILDDEYRKLRKLVQWQNYYAVSRTKLRHRVNYVLIKYFHRLYK